MITLHKPSEDDLVAVHAALADLGEPALSAEELEALTDAEDAAVVSALVELSISARDGAQLHAFDRRRVFRTIEGRVGAQAPEAVTGPAAGGSGSALSVLAAVAAAAAILILPGTAPPAAPQNPEAVQALREAAHAGLDVLGDTSPGAHARELAATYDTGKESTP